MDRQQNYFHESNKQEVPPGTILLSEKPFVYVLNSKLRTEHCDYCFKKGKLLKCSGCQYVYYCDRICQKEGWPVHKLECNNLKSIASRVVPNAARLLARLIRKLAKGGDCVKSYYGKLKSRTFKDLMSHYSDLKNDPSKLEHFTSLYAVLHQFLGENFMPNAAEMLGYYGRMCINSFYICDEELQSLGTGIYLAASIIDHSCAPNAVPIFQGTTLHIRTIKTLPHLDWNKVHICYVDVLNTTQTRQEELQSTYYFLCQCSKCLDVEEIKTMESAACPNTTCDACVDIDTDTHCPKCNADITDDVVNEYKSVMDFTNMHLANMKETTYLDVCKVCLKRQKGILHPLNISYIKALDAAFECSIDFAQWDDAVNFGTELIRSYRKYYSDVHPLLGILYLKLAKVLIYQDKSHQAVKYLKEAKNILQITHGENNSLFRETLIPLMYQAQMETI